MPAAHEGIKKIALLKMFHKILLVTGTVVGHLRFDLEIRGTIYIYKYDLYIRCICVTSIFTVYATPPQRLLTEEEARFRSLEAVANGAPVEQKDQCVDGGWGGSIPYRMPCIGLWGETRFKRFCLEVNSTTCSFG